MRVGIAMMSHETNTFSPVVTNLARFSGGRERPPAGTDAERIYRGTGTCLGGYLKVAEARGAEIVLGIAAAAPPSGRVDDDAYAYMTDAILDLAGTVDALLLDLHGAMATHTHDDGEGELLRRIRARHPQLPIAVSLDMHANVTQAMIDNCDVLTGYHTYPHIDQDTTAERGANLFFDMLEGKCRPVMRWGNAPMLPHVMRQGTDDHPNRDLQARAQALEASDCLAVSLFTGFPHADIADAGLSVVAIADRDAQVAERCVDELLDAAWRDREQFVYVAEPLEVSMAAARAAAQAPGDGPVILLDHYDNTASGGTMDTTDVLRAILAAGLEDVAVFGIYDPDAVEYMIAAGIGTQVDVSLGGKLAMPSIQRQSAPLEVSGEVKTIFNGRFKAQVPMSRGLTINMGRTVVLGVGGVDIVVISRHVEPYDPACLRSVGIEPLDKTFVMLKSRIHYRVGFKPIAKAIVECAGCGVCTSDYGELTFRNVRRPIYPLDRDPRLANLSRAEFAASGGVKA